MTERYRVQHKFWLDFMKPDQEALGEKLEAAKEKRAYTATIRDALTLFFALEEGDIQLLIERYPWVADAINKKPNGGDDDDDLRSDIRILKRQLADLTVMSHAPEGMLIAAQKQAYTPELKASDKPDLVLIDEPMDADLTGEFLNMFDDFG